MNQAGAVPGSDGSAPTPTSKQIEEWMVAHLAELLGLEPAKVDPTKPLYSYGISSREEVMLAGDLEDWLGRALPETLIWDYPTIADISRHLTEEPAANGS